MQPAGPASGLRRTMRALVLALALCAVMVSAPGASATRIQASTPAATPASKSVRQYVVVIDAGHQGKADLRLERIGPGSKKRKPRVAGGTRGVSTHKRESTVNLQVARKLRTALEKRGVKVVMVRTKQHVNISNSQRAKIANAANADLCIRIHCDGSANHKIHGLLTLVPKKNKWTGPIVSASRLAGKDVQRATIKATGAKNRGISKRGDMTGFNWAKVPCIIIEMGLMTNSAEDRKLASKGYQSKLVGGMTNGVMRFLER